MEYGRFISDYEKSKYEIENILYDLEHNCTTVIETGNLSLDSIIYDLENMRDKGERVPTFELLSLLPIEYELKEQTPEEHYLYSLKPYREHDGKISLFVSARGAFEPALKLAKEKYGWIFK